MLKELMKATAYRVAPSWARDVDERRWLAKQARMLRAECGRFDSLRHVVEIVGGSHWFPSTQKAEEVVRLLQIVRQLRPTRLCEIGTSGGGTLFLLCQAAPPDARILSIDIGAMTAQSRAFQLFARGTQQLRCLRMDSHAKQTLAKVEEWLAGQRFDFLLIDGDHSLSGVHRDYEMYAPCVRSGGIIALHDIVPDYLSRYGTKTPACTGGVPAFWEELKSKTTGWSEIIADQEQDGYGIGVVRWPGANR